VIDEQQKFLSDINGYLVIRQIKKLINRIPIEKKWLSPTKFYTQSYLTQFRSIF